MNDMMEFLILSHNIGYKVGGTTYIGSIDG